LGKKKRAGNGHTIARFSYSVDFVIYMIFIILGIQNIFLLNHNINYNLWEKEIKKVEEEKSSWVHTEKKDLEIHLKVELPRKTGP
jgi:hypothetical protein